MYHLLNTGLAELKFKTCSQERHYYISSSISKPYFMCKVLLKVQTEVIGFVTCSPVHLDKTKPAMGRYLRYFYIIFSYEKNIT